VKGTDHGCNATIVTVKQKPEVAHEAPVAGAKAAMSTIVAEADRQSKRDYMIDLIVTLLRVDNSA
jgi:hypothetical protein